MLRWKQSAIDQVDVTLVQVDHAAIRLGSEGAVGRLLVMVTLCVIAGCGARSKVDEVSVASSGVELKPTTHDLSQAWAGWRGPRGDGIAPDQPLPVTWSETEGVVWRVDVPGRGHSSPVVLGDLVLLATALEVEQKQMVLAYDRRTGQSRWSTTVHEGNFPPQRDVHQKGTHANGTVASDGARVYTAFLNGGKIVATALDMQGNQVWQTPLGEFSSKFGFAPSPVLYQSFAIIAGDHQGGGFLAALDSETGAIAWRIARPAINSHSSPLITRLADRDCLLISGCESVSCYDPATGDLIWQTPCLTETTCGTVVTDGERLFASGGWPDSQTVCLSPTGQILWENSTKVYEPSMVVTNNCLFAVNDDGIAHCWSATDGTLHWRKRLGGNFSASPVLCDGKLYVPNLNGDLFVFRATPEGYQELAVNRLGADCYASPAVYEGQMFLRIGTTSDAGRQEQLCCLGQQKDAE